MGRGQPPVNELAWGHDLVITTFTRLSADWTHHSASSPLKQVMHLILLLLLLLQQSYVLPGPTVLMSSIKQFGGSTTMQQQAWPYNASIPGLHTLCELLASGSSCNVDSRA